VAALPAASSLLSAVAMGVGVTLLFFGWQTGNELTYSAHFQRFQLTFDSSQFLSCRLINYCDAVHNVLVALSGPTYLLYPKLLPVTDSR
jgi:hypothetical protein